jgi:diguanylate cyclase (GGDEF)-like protein
MLHSRSSPEPLSQYLQLLDSSLRKANEANESLGLLLIHIADFDRLSSTYGLRAGNKIAKEFITRLAEGIREQDSVVRISESKFAVCITALRNHGLLTLAAGKLGDICRAPLQIEAEQVSATVRIGIATGPASAPDAETLHDKAQIALLTAIAHEADFMVFEPGQRERASDALQLEQELEQAIAQQAFEVHYQPKILAGDFRPCGAEALIRWNNSRRGPVSPEFFIPLADRPGRMEPLTNFVLNTAVRHLLDWPDRFSVSINVSAKMLLNSELIDMVGNTLGVWSIDPQRLCIEVTESALMTNPAAGLAALSALRDLGVQLSIDDFGTGYSSLAYFKHIPAHELKVDKSFVMNMLHDDGDKRIVNAVIQLSKGFGMEVTAEGVEDEPTARALARMGCDRLQGFHFARPMPQEALLGWLAERETRKLA